MKSGAMFRFLAILLLVSSMPLSAAESAPEPLGAGMEGFPYPYPVHYFPVTLEDRSLQMAYMDVPPSGSGNGRTALLLHGRNFGGYYWEPTIRFLSEAGYRVVVPDQVGFGKSSKPDLALSFHGAADQTRQLLDHLAVGKATIVAHSMGSMLGVRFSLMYPDRTEKLVLEGPIGLEDYRLKVPYAPHDELAREARAMTREATDKFFRGYFAHWKPDYQVFANVAWGWNAGPDADLMARVASHTYQMAYEQPVVYEFPRLRTPVLLVAGNRDRSAIGRNRVSPEVRETMGRFIELVPATVAAMPDARGEILDNVGHIPHLEATDRFHAELQRFLQQ